MTVLFDRGWTGSARSTVGELQPNRFRVLIGYLQVVVALSCTVQWLARTQPVHIPVREESCLNISAPLAPQQSLLSGKMETWLCTYPPSYAESKKISL